MAVLIELQHVAADASGVGGLGGRADAGGGAGRERTSLVKKSAPMVALYWLENFLFTYWFMRDVLPTPLSPRMMTFNSTFLRAADMTDGRGL